MTVYPVRPGTEAANKPVRNVGEGAGTDKDMFLRLMIAQLQNQDPSSPMDQKDMMAQMAQFTQVEQSANMVKALENLTTNSKLAEGANLIGKTIDYAFPLPDGSSEIRSSRVTHVTHFGGEVRLKLQSDISVRFEDIIRVGA